MFMKSYGVFSGVAAALSVVGVSVWAFQQGVIPGTGDRRVFLERIATLEQQLETARESRTTLTEQLTELQNTLNLTEAERIRLLRTTESLERQQEEISTGRSDFEARLEALQQDKARLTSELEKTRSGSFVGELIRRNAELEVVRERVNELERVAAERDQLAGALEQQRAVSDRLSKDLAQAQQGRESAQQELQAVTREYEALRLRLAALEADYQVVKRERDALAAQSARLQQELEDKSRLLQATQRQLIEEQVYIEELEKQREALAARADQLEYYLSQTAALPQAPLRSMAGQSFARQMSAPAQPPYPSGSVQLAPIVVSDPSQGYASRSGREPQTYSAQPPVEYRQPPQSYSGEREMESIDPGQSPYQPAESGRYQADGRQGGQWVDPPSQRVSAPQPTPQPQPQVRSASSQSPQASSAMENTLKILTINDRHHFVVIDAGKDSGATVGQEFYVLRNGQPIGEVRVIEVRRRISAADIISASAPFAEGDFVSPK